MNIFVPKGHQKDPTKNASIWTGGITDFPCKSLIEPYWSHYFANPRQVSVEQALQQRETMGNVIHEIRFRTVTRHRLTKCWPLILTKNYFHLSSFHQQPKSTSGRLAWYEISAENILWSQRNLCDWKVENCVYCFIPLQLSFMSVQSATSMRRKQSKKEIPFHSNWQEPRAHVLHMSLKNIKKNIKKKRRNKIAFLTL